MTIPTPAAGRRGLVEFRLLGFPVSIHTSFLVIVLLLGYNAETGVAGALVWLAVVTVSVLAHELGHAIVAKPAGGEPRIDLYMLAGLTTWRPHRASKGRRVAVSLAGAFAGCLFGAALLAVYVAWSPPRGTLQNDALFAAVYVNLGWGLVNLLPMLPLDGGQIVLALMPGRDDVERLKRASVVSLAVGALVALAAWWLGAVFAAILVVFFAAGNAQRLVALRRPEDPSIRALADAEMALHAGRPEETLLRIPDIQRVPQSLRPQASVIRAAALLRLGRFKDAQDQLLDLPPGSVDPVFEGTVLLANGQEQLARERLAAALANNPPAWAVRELVLLLRRRDEDVVGMVGEVTGTSAAGVLDALFETGDYAAAAAWGERALATGGGDPGIAYNTACAYYRAGDTDKAERALGYAAELGWDDVEMADGDPDLAALRERPSWPAIRARMESNPGFGRTYEPR